MLDLENVNLAIAEAGPLEEEILTVLRFEEDHWGIFFEPMIIELECDAAQGKLVLSGVIGTVPESRKVEMLEGLLSFNLLWRETGGVQACMTGKDGEAVLMVALTENEITPALIARVAANLAERVLLWRATLSLGNEGSLAEAGTHENHIRI